MAGASGPKGHWSSDCPHLHKGPWEPDGLMSRNPKRGGAGWPEEQEQIRQDADSPEAKHSLTRASLGPEGLWASGLPVYRRVWRLRPPVLRPLLPHTPATTTSSQAAPKALPARRCPCGLGRQRVGFFYFLEAN